jgi:hypothetical protein
LPPVEIFFEMKVTDIQRLEQNNYNCCYLIKDGIFWRVMNLKG